jgi:hypothetical protein
MEDGADFPGIDGVGGPDIPMETIEIDGGEEIRASPPGPERTGKTSWAVCNRARAMASLRSESSTTARMGGIGE